MPTFLSYGTSAQALAVHRILINDYPFDRPFVILPPERTGESSYRVPVIFVPAEGGRFVGRPGQQFVGGEFIQGAELERMLLEIAREPL